MECKQYENLNCKELMNYLKENKDITCDSTRIENVELDTRTQLIPHEHVWNKYIGDRYSQKRGKIQFWIATLVGIVVLVISLASFSRLQLDDVLHLGAFTGENVQVSRNFTYLKIQDEVDFKLEYDIASIDDREFRVFLLADDDEFENWQNGRTFNWLPLGSSVRGNTAKLELTKIDNVESEEYYFIILPCFLVRNNQIDKSMDYCDFGNRMPTPILGGRKIFSDDDDQIGISSLVIKSYKINPMPQSCSSTPNGYVFLFVFVPFVILVLFGLRVVQQLSHCRSFREQMECEFEKESKTPGIEVDYWQPYPWDRKVPKTRLCGPCCWRKIRMPFEPFYTWWRHENYFTWIFVPYRNEGLSRKERVVIVFTSLYITFYVLFVLSLEQERILKSSIIVTLAVVWLSILVLPTLVKAVFKELFKFVYRTRRKYFRLRKGGKDHKLSFRSAFLTELLVLCVVAVVQLPLVFAWTRRSCAFLSLFMYYWLLATIARLSIFALIIDFLWYSGIKCFGWRDLCPYCTERLVHCNDFNDDLLIAAVQHVGSKWALIHTMDKVLHGSNAQFEMYTVNQLRERWLILVDRARAHMKKVCTLRKRRLQQAKKDGVCTTTLGRIAKCTAGDDYQRELHILALNDKLTVCPISHSYHSNLSLAIEGFQSSIQNGLASLGLAFSPSERLDRESYTRDMRDRIYHTIQDSNASTTSDSDYDRFSSPDFFTDTDPMSSYEHIGNMESQSFTEKYSAKQKIKRASTSIGKFLDKMDT